MDVSVGVSTARRSWLAWVRNIDHEKTSSTVGLSAGSYGIDHLGCLVVDNVVGATETAEPGGNVVFDGEGCWLLDLE